MRHALLRPATPRHPPPTSVRLRILAVVYSLSALTSALVQPSQPARRNELHRRGRTPNRVLRQRQQSREHALACDRDATCSRMCLYPIHLSMCVCGAGRIRTADLSACKAALSQLSYDPTKKPVALGTSTPAMWPEASPSEPLFKCTKMRARAVRGKSSIHNRPWGVMSSH